MDIRVTAVRAATFRTCSLGLFAAAVEPGLNLAHANGVLDFGPLDANGQTGRGAERGVSESAAAELGECILDIPDLALQPVLLGVPTSQLPCEELWVIRASSLFSYIVSMRAYNNHCLESY